jgi:predicted RND superfamily exporter protein
MLFLTLLILIRSLPVVVASLATIGVASVCALGLLPLFGWQQSELTNGAATLILVIGADCVHFAAHYLETQAQATDTATALESTAKWVLAPCLLTTATTVGAFASFATGEVIALTQFGVTAAIGITLAFLLTFSLFPALLAVLPARSRSQPSLGSLAGSALTSYEPWNAAKATGTSPLYGARAPRHRRYSKAPSRDEHL